MLNHTFCHIPGVGLKTEQRLWNKGILCWSDLTNVDEIDLPRNKSLWLKNWGLQSQAALDSRNITFFQTKLTSDNIWRLFPEFRYSTAYLDIETNGGSGLSTHITAISLYNGKSVQTFVRGNNLADFVSEIMKYSVIVSYNGKCFDIPVIENYFGIRLHHAHIDLRFVLHSLGYRGGLKGCEKSLGLTREELDGVDGYFAVLLWKDYRARGNTRALETLLAYNVLDTINLEYLLVKAYNEKVCATPFAAEQILPMPRLIRNPYKPDIETIDRLKNYIEFRQHAVQY